jgi:hypothetical protein
MGTTFNPVTGAPMAESPFVQKNVSFTRPANTTAYAIGDAVSPATATITGATNANPSVVTTSAAHGLATDDRVTIVGSVGNTAINGTFKVVVLTATTFSLKTEAGVAVAGNGAWTSGGTVQKLLRFTDVVPAAGGSGAITAVRLQVSSGTITLGTFRVRFYTEPTTQIADNAAFTLLDVNRDKRAGYVDLDILATDGGGSDSAETEKILAQPLPFTCAVGRTDLFAQIIALGAYVPESGDTFKMEITVRRDQIPSLATVAQR